MKFWKITSFSAAVCTSCGEQIKNHKEITKISADFHTNAAIPNLGESCWADCSCDKYFMLIAYWCNRVVWVAGQQKCGAWRWLFFALCLVLTAAATLFCQLCWANPTTPCNNSCLILGKLSKTALSDNSKTFQQLVDASNSILLTQFSLHLYTKCISFGQLVVQKFDNSVLVLQ